jgi:glycosyltransferase involved in cell wall biosynthesis
VAQIEAMACGLPVVVTDVGDNGLVAEGAGLVVPPRDAAALARALAELVADPAWRARAGQAAAACASARFGADRLYAGVAEFYDALLAGSSLSGRLPGAGWNQPE